MEQENMNRGIALIEIDAVAETKYWMNCRPYSNIREIYKNARHFCRYYFCKTEDGCRYRPTTVNNMFSRLTQGA